MSADTGWSLLILFPDYNFSGRISEEGSILIAWEPLVIHPWVTANHRHMGLGRF